MRGSWPYSQFLEMLLVGFIQFILKNSCTVPIYLFIIRLVGVYIEELTQPPLGKKLRFILSDRSDSHMIDNLSIAVHAFACGIFISLSVDERHVNLPRNLNLPTNFREPLFRVEMSHFFIKTHVLCFVWIPIEANANCCLLQTMQQGFGLGWCISNKRNVIILVCVRNHSCRVSSASCFFSAWLLSFIRSIKVRRT